MKNARLVDGLKINRPKISHWPEVGAVSIAMTHVLHVHDKGKTNIFKFKTMSDKLKKLNAWRIKNPEAYRAITRKSYQKNREKHLARAREYYYENREKRLVQKRAYYQMKKEEQLLKTHQEYEAMRNLQCVG